MVWTLPPKRSAVRVKGGAEKAGGSGSLSPMAPHNGQGQPTQCPTVPRLAAAASYAVSDTRVPSTMQGLRGRGRQETEGSAGAWRHPPKQGTRGRVTPGPGRGVGVWEDEESLEGEEEAAYEGPQPPGHEKVLGRGRDPLRRPFSGTLQRGSYAPHSRIRGPRYPCPGSWVLSEGTVQPF